MTMPNGRKAQKVNDAKTVAKDCAARKTKIF